jgi:hypothetical protein
MNGQLDSRLSLTYFVKVSTSRDRTHRLQYAESSLSNGKPLSTVIFNFTVTVFISIKEEPDYFLYSRLKLFDYPGIEKIAPSVASKPISSPCKPQSWHRPAMFATCWICPQKASLDHTRSRRWLKNDQVGVMRVFRSGAYN